MFQIVKLISATVLGAVAAQASPWWATFDGSLGTYPDEQGWLHYATDPPAQRWLQDGSLFIDSRAAWGISDIYSQYHPGGRNGDAASFRKIQGLDAETGTQLVSDAETGTQLVSGGFKDSALIRDRHLPSC